MKFRIPVIAIFIFSPFINFVYGYNILAILPHPGISHFRFFQPLVAALANQGHNVYVVSHFPDENAPPNYHDLVLKGELLTNSIDIKTYFGIHRTSLSFMYEDFISLVDWGRDACTTLLNSTAIDEIFAVHERTPFDIVITEFFDSDCSLGIVYKLNVPFIGLCSSVMMPWHYDRVAQPDTPSFIPSEFSPSTDKMTFKERFNNWIIQRVTKISYRMTEMTDNALLKRRFGPGIPDVHEIAKNTSLIFLNTHYSFIGPRPLSPAVIEVGGLHIDKPKPLPEDIQYILDTAEHGVILVSWGSMIRFDSLPEQTRTAFVRAISKFPQRVLWKWENDTFLDKPDNVVTRKWLPQRDILCHPNVKAFISHAGLMGSTEAVYCGVPMVASPIYGDQFGNAAALGKRKIAVILELEDISEETMTDALRKALSPEMYQNAKLVSYSFNNRIATPLDTALWWVDHVIKTKGHRLAQSHAKELNWFIYYSLDVIGILFVCVILALYCIWIALKIPRILFSYFSDMLYTEKKKVL